MPSIFKKDPIVVYELMTEFTATFAFIAAVVASGGNPIVAGVALAIAIFLGSWFGDKANHLNPAITVGFMVAGKISPARGTALLSTQVLAGIFATVGVFLFKK